MVTSEEIRNRNGANELKPHRKLRKDQGGITHSIISCLGSEESVSIENL